MTRTDAIAAADRIIQSGRFETLLADWVAIPTDSTAPGAAPHLARYLDTGPGPLLASLGFTMRQIENPADNGGPMLIAERIEDANLTTVLSYGHGDTVPAMDGRWREGLSPLMLSAEGDRLYGRGTADNKGQHLINILALEAALESRGRLGFNIKFMIETGEEAGSAGLGEMIEAERAALAADVLIASDGPRVAPGRPTLFMGARGAVAMDLVVDLREGAHHSGNWGGLIKDPAIILAHALAQITDANGTIEVPEWRPDSLTEDVAAAFRDSGLSPPPGVAYDEDWGEPGLTTPEKMAGWNSFAVLALDCGDPDQPVNAIQPRARARCQLRFVVGTEMDDIIPALRRHLAARGVRDVEVRAVDGPAFTATRLVPNHPWVQFAAKSLERTTGSAPALMPNMGGSLPNEEFSDRLGMPTIWVPHSYAGCSQHAPDEHMLKSVASEGLRIMTGLWWDLGEGGAPSSGA